MALESYATLINRKLMVPTQKANYVAVETHFLVVALRQQVEGIHFDEEWYLERYPDIRTAISEGTVKSAHEHYVLHGFYEHRLPYSIVVEEAWYVEQYSDIKEAVHLGHYESGQSHFEQLGFREGRLPYPNFHLEASAS